MKPASAARCHQRAWQQHRAEIRGFLAHRSGSAAEADDLLQEVFVRALALGGKFCAIEAPRAWLFQVARNLLIDRLRLTRVQVPLPDDLSEDPGDPFEPIDELSRCLPRVLSELTPEDCEAITLCDLQGLSQQAFATRLGLSLPAAKSRVQRARRRLQRQLVEACQVKLDAAGKVCCFVPRPPLETG